MKKFFKVIDLIVIILILKMQTVLGYNAEEIAEAFESDASVNILKGIGLVLLVSVCLKFFDSRTIKNIKDRIVNKGYGSDADDRRTLRGQEKTKRQQNREARRSRGSSGGSLNISDQALAAGVGSLFMAGDWIGEKVSSAGKWVKNRAKAAWHSIKATKAPTPSNIIKAKNSVDKIKK